tara:strand:+ start:1146 stop:1526 length:381 start_codon:yes stop_codon:yes gene_type:complete
MSIFANLPNQLIMDIIKINTDVERAELAEWQADHNEKFMDSWIMEISYEAREYWQKYNSQTTTQNAFKFHYWLVGTGTQQPNQAVIPFMEWGGHWCAECDGPCGADEIKWADGLCGECFETHWTVS